MTTSPHAPVTDLANAIRALAMDAVEAPRSGHPGMPMGMAEIATALWQRHLRHNPANPQWPDRDRFVLSNGHGSMLLYALLHLTGYDLPQEELRNFRQLHSKTPGHPEVGVTPGVETTTGPLGQGLANAVGMALAERLLAAHFNRPGHAIVDHRTYVFVGDGCLMEGISHEAASLAGTLGLGKLTALYDDNGISIDGEVRGWFTDDTPQRFEAYGWNVIRGVDGHDVDAVDAALRAARDSAPRPTLICCKTVIGRGSPGKAGTAEAHGAPLGEKEVALARAALGWPHPPFAIPAAVYAGWDARTHGAALEADWTRRFEAYRVAYPDLAGEFERRVAGRLPADWAATVDAFCARQTAVAWAAAIERPDGPSALLFTRQNVAFQSCDRLAPASIRRGGYVLADWAAEATGPRATVIATGSEVALAMAAREQLRDEGIRVRVVSMPCAEVFDRQDAGWRAEVLPPGVPRVAVEAGSTQTWRRYVGATDDPRAAVVGIDRFGESAPAAVLFRHFGITVAHVAAAVRRVTG